MTSSKSTKRALLSSALAILMCVAMLIGATFAWFTDTASTGVNKIQSGKLDVALEMSTDGTNWESAEGKALTFKTKDNRAADQILWEPGCTYELPQLRVVNKGNLALKYKIQITGIQGDAKLNDVIDWTINDAAINLTEEHLTAGQTGTAFTIKGHMQDTAGNEYQNLTIDGIGITVYATQDTVENDSFNNQYDMNAEYRRAVFNGGSGIVDYNIYAQGYDGAIYADNGAQVTVNADVTAKEDKNYAMAVWADGANTVVNIEGGYFTQEITGTDNQYDMIYASGGAKINISGGTFKLMGGDYKWTLNCKDNSGSVITVTGGTFYKFDPSADRAGQGNEVVVPDGYSVYQRGEWYTVVKGASAVADTQEKLTNAINQNSEVTVKLTKADTYDLPEMSDKEVSIIGTKDTVIDMKNKINKAKSISFEGVTVNFGANDYCGFQHTGKLTYRDCTITGKQFLYGDEVEFNNCVFEQDIADYNVWTYGAGKVLFKDCTFNCAGKSVLIYNEGTITGQTVEFQNCNFNASTPVTGKAAIEIDSSLLKNGATYTVIIDQATANSVRGFDTGSVSHNSVWNNKKGTKATVIVAGSTVLSAS